MNATNNRETGDEAEHGGWPADGHPIFIDAGFGRVEASEPIVDGLGRRRRLTEGASVRSDADADTFAEAWIAMLSERPGQADAWEYAVEEPQPEEPTHTTGPLTMGEAIERVRLTPDARLKRRAVSRWQVAPTPFPSLVKGDWADLRDDRKEWHAAMNEFPPNYRGVISRMGGVDAAPQVWIEFARRAAAVGFTPQDYRMLGTAHLAWTAREEKSHAGHPRSAPQLQTIEVWALFPTLLAGGLSPLAAIDRIVSRL